MFQIWYEEDRKVKFEYKKGDTVKATFVEVGEFGGDIHLTHVGATKMVKEDTNMLELLIGENCEMFTDKPLSIEQICQLPFSQETATLNEVQVVTFKKIKSRIWCTEHAALFNHMVNLSEKRTNSIVKMLHISKWQQKVLLNAEIKDKYDHRTWITIFDQCAKVILSKSYDTFLDCSHIERVSILKEIENNEDLYFDLKVKKDQCNKIIAKQVKIIE
ncbi:unnamed protein product [Mytilus edulis]|uniref:Uncharacterized protein n=1 Tax=Mytilus edulis TaxID=6550 RepID=A0A8S3US96_MYTED|nr:unnamed protein product [Mytilus edulis]